MKTILWINPTGRDKRELNRITQGQNIRLIYHTYATDSLRTVCAQHQQRNNMPGSRMPCDEIQRITHALQGVPIDAVLTSRSYPSNVIATAIAHNYGLPGTSIESCILTQHKYYARYILSQHIPEANPAYQLLTYDTLHRCNLEPPFIIKPIIAAISMGTYYIARRSDIARVHHVPSDGYFQPLHELVATYTSYQSDTAHFIAESYTPGYQVTLDAWIQDGTIHILGIVDSHFYPNTLSFYKFTYPSRLSNAVCTRMYHIARHSLSALGLNNTMCNIEFVYNPTTDAIILIEINPRMSSQFSTLYEHVTGINAYYTALQLACNNTLPHYHTYSHRYPHAASFALRTPHDHYVYAIPSYEEKACVHEKYPHASIEICCQPGRYLSELPQDTYTYLYAIINVCAQNEDEAEAMCNDICRMLTFSFTQV